MRRRAAGVVVAALLLLQTGPAAAATPEEIARRIASARALAAKVEAPSPEAMDRVRATLGLPDTVLVEGTTITVPADVFLAGLSGEDAEDFRRAEAHLAALEEAIAERTGPPIDVSGLREDLAFALGTVEEADPGVLARLLELLQTILSRATEGAADALSGGVAPLVLVAVVLLVVGLVLRRGVRPVRDPTVHTRTGETSKDWRARAEDARARGALGEAVVCLYRALVLELDRRGLVADRPGLTAGDVRAAALALPVAADLVRDGTRRYERVRYGSQPASDEDVRLLERAVRVSGR